MVKLFQDQLLKLFGRLALLGVDTGLGEQFPGIDCGLRQQQPKADVLRLQKLRRMCPAVRILLIQMVIDFEHG